MSSVTGSGETRAVANVGDVIAAKYRIDRILGVGGMGMVAQATHLELDQKVALKFMLPEAMETPTAAQRFLREARACVQLRGEHVCRVLDVGRLDQGAPYIVMEYMAGQDFAGLLEERGTLQVRDAVDYMLQVLEGIAEAHTNGIIHRDLKPGNIFVTTDTDGSPLLKVLDFGISKSTLAGSATKTGELMGSPMYMAPEQMTSSKHVDARADIWALGCILYESISGQLPFTGETLPVLCVAVMTEDPVSIAVVRPNLPAPFAAAIMRCLAKAPEGRFSDVGALAIALAPFGSPGSDAAAVRVGKVLGRSSKPSLAAVGYDETVAPAGDASARLSAAVSGVAPSSTDGSNRVGKVSTLSAGAAQMTVPTGAPRTPVPWVIGGAALVVGGVIAFVLVSRRSSEPARAETEPTPAVVTNVADAAVAAPAVVVEKAVDPKVIEARAQLASVVTAFVRWSAANPSSPCPSPKDLASFMPNGVKDPWGHKISITCTEQPDDQMMGAVSLGPDGVRSADDIASWSLGEGVTGLVRGSHWVGAQRGAGDGRNRSRPRPPAATGSATSPAPTPTATVAAPPPQPPVEVKAPGVTLGSNGLPIGRTSR